jgi:hypothetical protein
MMQRDLNKDALDEAYRQKQFVVRTDDFGWEQAVIRVLMEGASITVVHNGGIRVRLDASEFARVKNVWSVARRRLARHGIETRTLEQLLLSKFCARAVA